MRTLGLGIRGTFLIWANRCAGIPGPVCRKRAFQKLDLLLFPTLPLNFQENSNVIFGTKVKRIIAKTWISRQPPPPRGEQKDAPKIVDMLVLELGLVLQN